MAGQVGPTTSPICYGFFFKIIIIIFIKSNFLFALENCHMLLMRLSLVGKMVRGGKVPSFLEVKVHFAIFL